MRHARLARNRNVLRTAAPSADAEEATTASRRLALVGAADGGTLQLRLGKQDWLAGYPPDEQPGNGLPK